MRIQMSQLITKNQKTMLHKNVMVIEINTTEIVPSEKLNDICKNMVENAMDDLFVQGINTDNAKVTWYQSK